MNGQANTINRGGNSMNAGRNNVNREGTTVNGGWNIVFGGGGGGTVNRREGVLRSEGVNCDANSLIKAEMRFRQGSL